MKPNCASFRGELEAALASGGASLLARHVHLQDCPLCRLRFEQERGLDRLLAELEDEAIPPQLARRILVAVTDARMHVTTCAGMPDAAGGDGALEQLLESIPEPSVPVGLADQILRGLQPLRTRRRAPMRLRPWILAAAATVLVGLGLWGWQQRGPEEPQGNSGPGAPLVTETEKGLGLADEVEADEELLAYMVERWELLGDDDLDLWLASLDPLDEVLVQQAHSELFDAMEESAATTRGH